MAHQHKHEHKHEHEHEHEHDWGMIGARLEREAEVTMPSLHDAFDAIAEAVGSADDVRRVLDLGSGPGVASVALAQRFAHATVTAVDTSAPLLDRVPARAARFGVGERVDTQVADIAASLANVAAPASVDVTWASMVLHHVVQLPRTLAEVHRLLRPGGVFAVMELNSLHGTLPHGFDVGRDGFAERLTETVRVFLEEHLPPGALTRDWPALVDAAGFDVLEHRDLVVNLTAPLDDAPRRLVFEELQGSAQRLAGRLDDGDRELLAALVDVTDPRCILSRHDLSLTISRTFLLARRR